LIANRFTTVIPKDLTTEAEIQVYQEKQHQFQIRVVRFIKVCICNVHATYILILSQRYGLKSFLVIGQIWSCYFALLDF
jgi:hypothetical protein